MRLVDIDPVRNAIALERICEIAVLISLFTAGLKLKLPWKDNRWRVPARLASVSMMLTVGGLALAGVYLLGLPLGAAVLLGAILAPTDPVLASDVQVTDADDRDRLRFGLTGEGGLNDGTAFPFVMLGLGLLGLHDLGAGGMALVGHRRGVGGHRRAGDRLCRSASSSAAQCCSCARTIARRSAPTSSSPSD